MKNILDLILVAVGILGCLQGYRKGLLGTVTSGVGSFSLASMLTVYLSPFVGRIVGNYLESGTQENHGFVMHLVVSILTFVLSRQLITYGTQALTNTLEAVKLGFLNRFLGGGFGFLKSLFVSIIVVVALDRINPYIGLIPQDIFEGSNLYTPMRYGLYEFVDTLWDSFLNSNFFGSETPKRTGSF